MFKTIRKRDNREVPYDIGKIAEAIRKAMIASNRRDNGESVDMAKIVERKLAETYREEAPTVEDIQDMVEAVLMENGYALVSKKYIIYRAERSRAREMNTNLMRIFNEITFSNAEDSDLKRDNANVDGDTAMGTMLKYGQESAKQFFEMFILDPKYSQGFIGGDFHIHDFDFFTLTTTCCQIDIDKLFTGGFSTGHGFIREPQSILSYASLACIAIQSNQNDQHGGQSIPNFDYAMAKGVAKSFAKLYRQNLVRALDFSEMTETDASVRALMAKIKEENNNCMPTIAGDNCYAEAELPLLTALFDGDEAAAQRAQKFARRHAMAEIETATYQAMEALVHNLNTMHSRAGAQVPFSSLNYGTDTSPEGRLLIRSILLATDAGMGNGETPIFPIHIFKVKEGVNYNPEDPNYDLFKLACKVSAKRLFPNFSFLDAPFNKSFYKPGRPETEVAYMGCRTRVASNNYDPENETTYGRGNLSFTSVNLPRIAIKAHGNVDIFFEELERWLDVVCDQLMDRYRIVAQKTVRNFPFLMGQGIWLGSDKLSLDDCVGEILKHGTLTVGFIGLAETLVALMGKHHGESQEAQNLGLDIVGFMRRRMDQKSRETGFNYSLIATPGEGLSGRFVRIDKEKYGIIPGVTSREYYTNSFHVPVYHDISAHDKIAIEAPYHALTNGGHITYVELDGDPLDNLEAFESVVRFMKESGVGYGSINHPVDRDPVCGFNGIIDNECPRCGRTEADGGPPFERIRRITGYLVGTLENFNNAKRAEVRDRVKHDVQSGLEDVGR